MVVQSLTFYYSLIKKFRGPVVAVLNPIADSHEYA